MLAEKIRGDVENLVRFITFDMKCRVKSFDIHMFELQCCYSLRSPPNVTFPVAKTLNGTDRSCLHTQNMVRFVTFVTHGQLGLRKVALGLDLAVSK